MVWPAGMPASITEGRDLVSEGARRPQHAGPAELRSDKALRVSRSCSLADAAAWAALAQFGLSDGCDRATA